eukprot:g10561.t1 g10561   contig4:2108171-2109118(-)
MNMYLSSSSTTQQCSPIDCCCRVELALTQFYKQNTHIGESHGLSHVMAVHNHAVKAIESHRTTYHAQKGGKLEYEYDIKEMSDITAMEIRIAAMLHDADDRKFFPEQKNNQSTVDGMPNLPNALEICKSAGVPIDSFARILKMITWVGCTENGNAIPTEIESGERDGSQQQSEFYQQYHYLIPRWSDRLEAVGAIGIIRCYQYNREVGAPLQSDDEYDSPRPKCEEEVWKLATPERFAQYLSGEIKGGNSMISHYYDKLLHVARPPPAIVRNEYLEAQAKESSKELVEVCLRFGKTGVVDEEYIVELEKTLTYDS